jgi:hypothetical protein
MLSDCPLTHLEGACRSEEQGGQGTGGQGEKEPPQDLCRVVGACDEFEKEAAGDDISLLAGGSQVCQYHVAPACVMLIASVLFDPLLDPSSKPS